jgi:predicted alpha/beta superfamily hydrolase
MKIIHTLTLGLSFFLLPVLSQAQTLKIIVNVPTSTPLSASLFLTGDGFNSCNWSPACIRLQAISPQVFGAEITPTRGRALNSIVFKVTRGNWNAEAADSSGAPFQNAVLNLKSPNATTILNVINWKDFGKMGVTGNLTHASVYSPELQNSREVYVWFPESYATSPGRRYPVIYMHDGQNLFDPGLASFGNEWGMDEAMTRLARAGKIPEAIIVGAACTGDRDAEYDFSLKGAQYAAFLVNTLKPLIDRNFRTMPNREATFIMGSSMGATISVETAWAYPSVFSAAAGLSLPVFVTNNSIYKVLQKFSVPGVRIYMDHGTDGQDGAYHTSAAPFAQWLNSIGISGTNLMYQVFQYADHNEVAWSRRVATPLQFLLRGAR